MSHVSQPPVLPRGASTVAVTKCCSQLYKHFSGGTYYLYICCPLTAAQWLKLVVTRHISGGRKITIPCPVAMVNYHKCMGEVDIRINYGYNATRFSLQYDFASTTKLFFWI
ncbi:hypothetical protein PHMEG_00023183 [Phytophthora megakarya]|uniref:Uncharacterized protein n=1 Tax=Phytophthora megakarya TaxID=4795 RepID=A0A225VIQ0_9STRA|nr:hypothetical protein PHMEG_00023183 [Phytophthora megakarya]